MSKRRISYIFQGKSWDQWRQLLTQDTFAADLNKPFLSHESQPTIIEGDKDGQLDNQLQSLRPHFLADLFSRESEERTTRNLATWRDEDW